MQSQWSARNLWDQPMTPSKHVIEVQGCSSALAHLGGYCDEPVLLVYSEGLDAERWSAKQALLEDSKGVGCVGMHQI